MPTVRSRASTRSVGGWSRRWVGDKVTLDVQEVANHYGDIIVRAAYDGEFDKTNLPDPLIMSNYFSVRDGRIISLAVIRNTPSPY
jgi:hypothetical protein